MPTETAEDDTAPSVAAAADNPGLIAVFAGEQPCCRVFPLTGRGLGREELAAAGIDDARVSRSHVLVEREGDRWCVRDLGSRNGTYVHGRPAQVVRHAAPVIRVGRTLLIATRDCRPFAAPGVVVRGDAILGPTLQAVHARVAATAASRAHLLIQGESGTGKELAARAYHAASGAEQRPFVAVNCATIPRELAERLLFGARKGVYTGAVSDAVGLVQAADRGTLFLDEIAELDLGVQSKLLRVIETGTVTMLGGVAPVAVDVRVCAATLRNLRAEVAAGRFREDLYFRIGRPEVRLPPLRERREEIPWLVARALQALPVGAPVASVEFVEACLLREWPGNIRELATEVATAALAAGEQRRAQIAAADIDDEAGRSLQPPASASVPEESDERPPDDLDEIVAALRAEHGNVARAAVRLAIPRTSLRRAVARHGIDLRSLRAR